MFTPHQRTYFAHWLTQSGKIENQISRVMTSAKIDMNPHQIDAACFALKSPIEKGVILADEVGLGKTIEAGLVMAQKWAENKQSILLVVPASLRKQWNQELFDKFELPSLILDSKIYNKLKRDGELDPFTPSEKKIIICSYEYAASQKSRIEPIEWDLVVFDEAHKLRNLYKKGSSKRAKATVEATRKADSRILLSATPLQNSLMELYGLSRVIDEHFFGDEKSFKTLYASKQKNKAVLEKLRKRIEPLCHRTLRRQVQEEGGINFTNRYSITQDFTPSDQEWDLYQQLNTYLQDPENQAINFQARHLVGMNLRKTLASSSFAVLTTLETMLERLKNKQQVTNDDLSDLENADERLDEDLNDEEIENHAEASRLQQEIETLTACREIAANITDNAKGEALLIVLEKAMTMTESLGGQRKAVIFTESCRTQQYINDHLQQNGYQGKTVLLNGSNSDVRSQQIYKSWLATHQHSARVSGSKAADMKAALVDYFKSDQADILIATEAGGEGINLQFCSVLINYDLPWNPQKIEQRIGRVHRYGQKNDVVVVNFLNQRNKADQQVFHILNKKLNLFEGVFGASDQVLGAIEDDLDIEKTIYELYQNCRPGTDIDQQFKAFREKFSSQLDVREEATRTTLLNNFDPDVIRRLKNTRDASKNFLDEYQQVLMNLAKASLPKAQFEFNHFFYENERYDLTWAQAEENNSEFFRLQSTQHYLAWDLVKAAKKQTLERKHLQFHYSKSTTGKYGALAPYIGATGLLRVLNIRFIYNNKKDQDTTLLVLAQTHEGEKLSHDNAEHLLQIPAMSLDTELSMTEAQFTDWQTEEIEQLKIETDKKLASFLEEEADKLERWANDQRMAYEQTIATLDEDIRQFKKEARHLGSAAEKVRARTELRKLERARDDAMDKYHQAKKTIEQDEDALLEEVSLKLESTCEIEELFTIQWSLVE